MLTPEGQYVIAVQHCPKMNPHFLLFGMKIGQQVHFKDFGFSITYIQIKEYVMTCLSTKLGRNKPLVNNE